MKKTETTQITQEELFVKARPLWLQYAIDVLALSLVINIALHAVGI